MIRESRFSMSGLFAYFAAMMFIIGPTFAQTPAVSSANSMADWRHGLSLMGEVKYPKEFKHFDYVNPKAPKGGVLRMSTQAVFDTFNIILPKGVPAPALSALVYQQLMDPSHDEISTQYGQLAEAAKYPADFSSVTYKLRENAKWHDGQPVTAADVIWSFDTIRKLNPAYAFYYANVVNVKETAPREVTFTFNKPGNREIPHIIGQITVLPKHWWEGKDKNGKKRNINEGLFEAPLGSGPYRVKNFVAGRSVVYERVKDWWGKDVPSNIGLHNFDEIRFDAYRDDTVELEAFKSDYYDFRHESSAKNWATAYDFPAVKQGKVIKEMFPITNSGRMQGFVFNLRRPRFTDARVRRAFNHAFDFEEINRSLFFGQYERINSYFHGTELAARGLPKGLELEILESVRGKVPPEVFTKPYDNPKGGNSRAARDNLREALRLMKEAGWTVRDGKLRNEKGEVFQVEFLLDSPTMERIVLPYKAVLDRLGFEAAIRTVDSSQYLERLRKRDFDVLVGIWAQSLSPGNEQREFWGSAAADREGSRNLAGIKNEAVDILIDRVVYAKDRDELVAATHALDRVLLWNEYVVPHFMLAADRTARWNRFSHPEKLPAYSYAFPDIWWYDEEKAKQTGAPR